MRFTGSAQDGPIALDRGLALPSPTRRNAVDMRFVKARVCADGGEEDSAPRMHVQSERREWSAELRARPRTSPVWNTGTCLSRRLLLLLSLRG